MRLTLFFSFCTLAANAQTGIFESKSALQDAVDLWCSDEAAAILAHGDISLWDVSAVTDMRWLFSNKETCSPNISAWELSAR